MPAPSACPAQKEARSRLQPTLTRRSTRRRSSPPDEGALRYSLPSVVAGADLGRPSRCTVTPDVRPLRSNWTAAPPFSTIALVHGSLLLPPPPRGLRRATQDGSRSGRCPAPDRRRGRQASGRASRAEHSAHRQLRLG